MLYLYLLLEIPSILQSIHSFGWKQKKEVISHWLWNKSQKEGARALNKEATKCLEMMASVPRSSSFGFVISCFCSHNRFFSARFRQLGRKGWCTWRGKDTKRAKTYPFLSSKENYTFYCFALFSPLGLLPPLFVKLSWHSKTLCNQLKWHQMKLGGLENWLLG